MTNSRTSSRWLTLRFFAGSLAFWLCYGGLSFLTTWLAPHWRQDYSWPSLLLRTWPLLLYAIATPLLFECAYRAGRGGRSAVQYYLRLLVALLVSTFVTAVVSVLVMGMQGDPIELLLLVMAMAITWIFHYAAILGVGVAINQFQMAQLRKQELLDAQLRALRSQLQPHFLFNTLQAISVTTRRDPDAAVSMLSLLGDLLRQTLRERDGALVTLADEQELLRPYLELQQKRFADRLTVAIDVPDEVLGAAVPDMIMQPLVENALQHGIESLPGSGTVRIRARRQGDELEIEVADDGAGPRDVDVADGIGLGTTRARLAALFGDRAHLKLMSGGSSGTVVVVRMPWQELARAA